MSAVIFRTRIQLAGLPDTVSPTPFVTPETAPPTRGTLSPTFFP